MGLSFTVLAAGSSVTGQTQGQTENFGDPATILMTHFFSDAGTEVAGGA